MNTLQTVQAYEQPGRFEGIGWAVMALTWAAVITLLLTWAPTSSADNNAAPDAALGGTQTAVAIEAPAGPRHGLNDLSRRPTCAALGENARTPDIAEIAQARDAVGCGIPDTLAEGAPTPTKTASE